MPVFKYKDNITSKRIKIMSAINMNLLDYLDDFKITLEFPDGQKLSDRTANFDKRKEDHDNN
jgi:hypothetical protein